jgi:hypothetical protein
LRRLGADLAGALDGELVRLHPEGVGDEDFGVGARVLHARGGDALGRVVEDRPHGAGRRTLVLHVNSRHYRPILPS